MGRQVNMDAKVVDKKLLLEGFIYLKSKSQKNKTYWDCKRLRAGECKARAITTDPDNEGRVRVIKF